MGILSEVARVPRAGRWAGLGVSALLVSTLALSGCAGGASSGSGGSGDLQSLTLMTNTAPQGGQSDFYYTKATGGYAKEGLDVQIQSGTGSAPAIDAVASGKVDVADASCSNMILAVGQGRPVISIGIRLAKPSFGFFVSDPNIKTIGDLKNHSLVMASGTPSAALVPFILKQAGVDFNSQINVLGVTTSQQLSAYSQGQGDALVTPRWPTPTRLSSRRGRPGICPGPMPDSICPISASW